MNEPLKQPSETVEIRAALLENLLHENKRLERRLRDIEPKMEAYSEIFGLIRALNSHAVGRSVSGYSDNGQSCFTSEAWKVLEAKKAELDEWREKTIELTKNSHPL